MEREGARERETEMTTMWRSNTADLSIKRDLTEPESRYCT